MSYTESERQQLLYIARESIRSGLTEGRPLEIVQEKLSESLQEKRATFVTLNEDGKLRGCVGTITPCLSLAQDVAQRAYSAAFGDPRFPRVQPDEVDSLVIGIAVLTPLEAIHFANEAELLEQIQPNIDGLILHAGSTHRGLFLPNAWETLPDKQQLLQQLKLRAGLPKDYWSDELKVSRFHAEYMQA
ncbi:MAG: AmmeMemoRadiSam system protein A [Gammaproteobacteria bacterium]|nr:AmmeMemoRadiSam system protein A [Gammaproteobacteria bacterium]MBU1723314.1 AmmeMemoRadiSam system protein A [Gammaproteobacteria bacterium]MBU2006609.1 AmmeMemoRadiSam system protein A [Gammaproteobacteria bacterium]